MLQEDRVAEFEPGAVLGQDERCLDLPRAFERKILHPGLIPFPHVVVDRNLVTSRYWLFDAEPYAKKFAEVVQQKFSLE